ncbi:MAG: DUF4191 domain-containing protein [Actinomycetes bacterium]
MATAATPPKQSRVAQIRSAYRMTKQGDPQIGLILAGVFFGTLVVFLLIGLLIGHVWYLGVLGLLAGIALTTIVFGRRAERSAYSSVEGQPGAAAAVLQTLRRGWTVTPAVAVNRQQDLVHRAVGRPGVVLVGEGSSPSRVTQLLANERKRLARVVPDVPVHELQAGNGEGQVPLRKLTRHVMKLKGGPLAKADIAEVNKRLRAMGTPAQQMMPRGPLPKGARMPKMPRGTR